MAVSNAFKLKLEVVYFCSVLRSTERALVNGSETDSSAILEILVQLTTEMAVFDPFSIRVELASFFFSFFFILLKVELATWVNLRMFVELVVSYIQMNGR